jgi:hypothetical protein
MILVAIAAAAAAAEAGTYTAPVPRHLDSWIAPVLDFPVRGIEKEVFNIVDVHLTVNQYGGMAACSARSVRGNPNMAEYTCDILKNRTEFKPARDPSGKRMFGVYRVTINWWLSEDKPPPEDYDRPAEFQLETNALPTDPKDRLVSIQFAVDTAGNGSSCSAAEYEENAALAQSACERLAGRLRVQPARDRGGRPVPSVQAARVKFVLANAHR